MDGPRFESPHTGSLSDQTRIGGLAFSMHMLTISFGKLGAVGSVSFGRLIDRFLLGFTVDGRGVAVSKEIAQGYVIFSLPED